MVSSISLVMQHCDLQVDSELSKEMEQWNEMLRADVVKLCQDNNFNTGFFEGTDNSIAVDAYELKVTIHIIV
jgi:atypical dual specificity phosphatase